MVQRSVAAHFPAPFVQLGQPDQRHQVKLVDRQRLLERRPLGVVVAGQTLGLGQVHPQGDRRRICRGGSLEMLDRLTDIARLERRQTQGIARFGVVRIAAQGLSPQ